MVKPLGWKWSWTQAFYGVTDPPSTLDPDGQLDGYVSYLVYAKFQNPTDVLSAVFADVNGFAEGGPIVHCKRWVVGILMILGCIE